MHIHEVHLQKEPMSRLAYNEYRGWEVPKGEDENDEGYLISYFNGQEKVHENWMTEGSFFYVHEPEDSFKIRLFQEKKELKTRLKKLECRCLRADTGYLHNEQLEVMKKYFDILEKRLARF